MLIKLVWIKIVSRHMSKKIHDNTIKDYITVTSSNFSPNNGTIRILTHFLPKMIINYQCCFYDFTPVICAFEVIKLPNERVIALFHHFFLQFVPIAEIGQKAHNTTTSGPPVPCISQILTAFKEAAKWKKKSKIWKPKNQLFCD